MTRKRMKMLKGALDMLILQVLTQTKPLLVILADDFAVVLTAKVGSEVPISNSPDPPLGNWPARCFRPHIEIHQVRVL